MRYPIRIVSSLASLVIASVAWSADLQKGLAAYDVGDYETSLAECQPLADAGDAAAQFCVGRLYANGFGVPMDDAVALRWYGAAAAQGHAEAQFNLAVFTENGWGVAMDSLEAAKWYRLSAEQGFLQAQSTLAKNYQFGRGVDPDLVEAYKWYAIAAQGGDYAAQTGLDEVAAALSPEQLAKAQQDAQQWLADHVARTGQ
ncbi:MAG: sel1 repeat family protein [Gammaproteobacteria bacterium]|nr:sel1 repeat family protein [Gammaproteobacteria bacterium]MDH5302661.1 sel1 repeat family protein [Gammaproteobacteria bacterium]MDH5320902.1 sel1 repeat family protein [Gammaproteobacteria bacterium]